MLRIGIYTLPLNYNYGGLLQAWGLQTTLERMGHQVTFIDRPLHPVEAIWKRPKDKVRRFVQRWIKGDRRIRVFEENYEARIYPIISQYTQPFIDKHLHRFLVDTPWQLKESDFDAIVVGSDQIWRRPFLGSREKCYNAYLDFAEQWTVKRIAYAASFGTNRWEYDAKDTRRCQQLVHLFNAVSTREASGVQLCEKYLGIQAEHVFDPTLLLDKSDYDKLYDDTNTTQSAGNQMCYVLDQNSQIQQFADILQQKYGLTSFRVNSDADNIYAPVEERIQPPVEQWLRGFQDASLIVTDSFHACVFSILYGKPFLVIGNVNRGMERFTSLLSDFGLIDLLITPDSSKTLPSLEELKQKVLDARALLQDRRRSSIEFLKKALND